MNYHLQLLEEIKSRAHQDLKHQWVSSYLGTTHHRYGLRTPVARLITKEFVKNDPSLSDNEITSLLNSLFAGQSFEEKGAASHLLEYLPKYRRQLDPLILDSWLDDLVGWAEIDTLCQSNFTAKDLLSQWDKWSKLILKLNHDPNIGKRRASLVLLANPVIQSDELKLAVLAFENICRLKHENDILITKAISWLLRSLIQHHRTKVEEYLSVNRDSLPKIAVRETNRKLQTGKK